MNKGAVLTLTGDNALTIGIIGAGLYLGSVMVAQLWMRGMAKMGAKAAPKPAAP